MNSLERKILELTIEEEKLISKIVNDLFAGKRVSAETYGISESKMQAYTELIQAVLNYNGDSPTLH